MTEPKGPSRAVCGSSDDHGKHAWVTPTGVVTHCPGMLSATEGWDPTAYIAERSAADPVFAAAVQAEREAIAREEAEEGRPEVSE